MKRILQEFMAKRLIGIYSPAPQSGKTFAATVLAHRGFQPVSFAEPLKRMIVEFLISLGYEKDQALKLAWVDKESNLPQLDTTARRLLQTLGTEWGRNNVCEDVWVRVWKARAQKHDLVVVDDVRFENEAAAVKESGGELWKIVRPSATHNSSHVSEGGLDSWDGFDVVIENNGTIEDFRAKIDLAICNAKQ
jgi:hypothetical protein